MKHILSAALLCVLLSLPSGAGAVDISGQSRTYLQSRQDVEGTRYLPLYEYLNFSAGNAPSEAVSFHFGGWYRYDLRNEAFGKKSTGDLQYAYLTVKRDTANSALSLGRILVNEGVISSQLDGLYARTDLRGGFRLAAYGGSPVETDGDTRSGDSVYGGRLSHGIMGIYTIGVSYLQEKNDRKDFRKESGVDLWLKPFNKLEVMGKSSYNDISSAWMLHQYTLLFGPFGDLRLSADASKVYYKEYFAATTTSAFTFPSIDPNETVTTLGGSADYALTASLSAGIDFKNFDYTVANNTAKYYGARIAYASAGLGAGLAAHRMDGPTERLQYDDLRVYMTKKLSRLDLTLDAVHVAFQQPISGESDAYTGSAAAGWSFSQSTRLVADVQYAKTPDYDKDVRGMLTLIYNFDVRSGGAAKPAGAARPGQKKP